MIITQKELIELNACDDGLETFVEANGDSATIVEALESNDAEDVFWYLNRVSLEESKQADLRRFAKDEALINIELIKPYCSKEDYQLILGYLKSYDLENREEVLSKTDSIAKSINKSTYHTAAWLAACSATWAADESIACSAAWAATRSAACSASRTGWGEDSSTNWLSKRSKARSKAAKRQKRILKAIFQSWLQ